MNMPVFLPDERRLAKAVARLSLANPFLPERIEAEREALGAEFEERPLVWSILADEPDEPPNVDRIGRLAESLAERVRSRLAGSPRPVPDEDRALYEDLILYALYHRFRNPLRDLIEKAGTARETLPAPFFSDFLAGARHFSAVPGMRPLDAGEAAHVFACAFQIRRAFHHIFLRIVGGSMPAARLRAAVWQSIFTHDMRRYRRSLYAGMSEITTLVTGPSGTGKDLVASSIALSRYLPFDPRALAFPEGLAGAFLALNLPALSPTLIESEMFGHRRGAFTGALADRAGFLETCRPLGTVFLDEIGEVDPAIQVKLLRVLETRVFHRIGDTEARRFRGKLVAATNRDLSREMAAGRFRADLYYRICADIIETPSLSSQLASDPFELRNFLILLARRVAGTEAEAVAAEVEAWIRERLGEDYPWPGNVRELEQCVRNVLVRKEYRPGRPAAESPEAAFLEAARRGELSAEAMLSRYCTLVLARAGSYAEAARRLGLDRRSVKAKVDPALLHALRAGGPT